MLSPSEYDKLRADSIAKGVKLIPLFKCNERSINRLQTIARFRHLYLFLNTYLVGYCLAGMPSKLGLTTFFYGITGAVTAVHLGLYYVAFVAAKRVTLQIDWDIVEEVFVVKKPTIKRAGVKMIAIPPRNFAQLEEDDPNSLYYNKETGERF